MEPSPLALSVFLSGEDLHSPDVMVLSHISRMLMEDDIDDKLLHQYSDHPALLQEQECSKRGGLRKRYNSCEDLEEEVGRSSKAMVLMETPEEMLDEMMLHGYDTCIRDMEKLRIAMADEAEKNRKGGRKTTREEQAAHCGLRPASWLPLGRVAVLANE
ncbi:hypothetical protein BAE44_0018292 [Dichanthelium oligosanthes]|uniref:Uncharacterized protein n=1 Tax=Dichanthelium oligosanthes TaxID=888268 RepID=A0A1E5V6L2_9POAL|nr:hypothetical protein BAE44_0018292 [Dichanthelium oligosanthes]